MMDIQVENHGTIHLLRPQTQEAQVWLEEHTDGMWMGGALACEPRFTLDILLGMREAGLTVPLVEA